MTLQSRWCAKLLFSTMLAMLVTIAGCSRGAEAPADQGEPAAQATRAANPLQGALPLPSFTPCASTSKPMLPTKWQASALLQDFFLNTLTFGNFIYDESTNAFRFAIADQYGMDLDFLTTTGGQLYLLEGGGEMPTSCTLLTNSSPFTVPSRAWLGASATCVGQAPLLQREQQWWKNPSGAVGANWFWYNTSNSLPFRSMYYADPTTAAPIYEHFTFNYFPVFQEVGSTNLDQILQMCQSTAKTPTATAEYSKPSIEPLLKRSQYPQKEARLTAEIQSWLPGVTDCASTSDLPPKWPDQLQITAFMTAVNAQYNPFPTRIYYDWTKKSQNTTLYYYPPSQQHYAQTALLLGDTGYIAYVEEGGDISSCAQVLPGPPLPNWKQIDGCECRAQIAPGTVLNPSTVPTKILWCPTDLELEQVFWTWYSDTGTPVVFMQSNSSPTAGTGLNLADYYQWGPGSVAPAGTYALPQACQNQPIQPGSYPKACNNCHLPLNKRGTAARAAVAAKSQ